MSAAGWRAAFAAALKRAGLEVTGAAYTLSGIPSDRGGFAAAFEVKSPALRRVKDFAHMVGFVTSSAGNRGFTGYAGGKDLNANEFYVHSRLDPVGQVQLAKDVDGGMDGIVQAYLDRAAKVATAVPGLRGRKVSPAVANQFLLGLARTKQRYYNVSYSAVGFADRAWRDPPFPEGADRSAWNLLLAASAAAAHCKPVGSGLDRRWAAHRLLRKLLSGKEAVK